jgi:hypothetical protein
MPLHRTRRFAPVLALPLLTACSHSSATPVWTPSSSYPTRQDSSAVSTPRAAGVAPAQAPAPAAAPAPLPAALVGNWSGDDRDGLGSWTLTITSAGRYRMTNDHRGVDVSGRVAARGRQLVMQPAGAAAYAVAWSVNGGRLTLNGSVYLRTDGASAGALVGDWISLQNTYRTVTFTPDGRFRIADPTTGDSTGRYRVSSTQLTIIEAGAAPVAYGWSVDGAFLRLRRADGRVAEYTRSG